MLNHLPTLRPITSLIACLALAGCGSQESHPSTVSPTAPTATATPADEPVGPATKAPAKAELGQQAADFELPSLAGDRVKLSSHRGKIVVLEWFNPDCPFVKQAHGQAAQLKGMAAKLRQKNVVWLAVNSSAAGRQGHGLEANERGKQRFAIDYPILLDPSGETGRAYGAQRTPHIFVIDPAGTLVYRGALDNTGGGDPEDANPFTNYAVAAIDDITAGRAVATPETEPYGCTVKY